MGLTYHNYKTDSLISVDTEAYDPYLTEKGNGVYRNDGKILGVSFSNGELSEYYPLRHIDTSPEKFEQNLRYIRDQLSAPNKKVFANAIYDLDWLVNWEGIGVGGELHDIQLAEPLINEYRRSYSLNTLSQYYLNSTKLSQSLDYYAVSVGIPVSKSNPAIKHIKDFPGEVVAPYGQEDTRLTIEVFKQQLPILERNDLMGIYTLERSLIPLLLQMRKIGVRIDKDKLFKTGMNLADIRYDLQEEIDSMLNISINVNSNKDLEKVFNKFNIPIVYGEPTKRMIINGIFRGNPSFKKEILSRIDHPIVKKILELRHISTLLNLFFNPYPDLLVGDRLHCNFNQLRSDESGTVSGRLSSSNPNLQQVSGKKEEDFTSIQSDILSGQIVRKLFIPEDGYNWVKMDLSQIEYRLIAHYALGEGSELIRARYNSNPKTDYHEELGKMTNIDDRKTVKNLNFGAAYGMGKDKMAITHGWDYSHATTVYNQYHRKVPFVKETSNRVGNKAKRVGFIKTILNRRCHIPASNKAYVMFNRLIQGSAADVMKKSMADAYNAGLFNVLYPHLVVHDEWDVSSPNTKEGDEASKELKHIMETCVKIKVPIIAQCEKGKNWGELEKWEI